MSSVKEDNGEAARKFLSALLEKAAAPDDNLYAQENAAIRTVCWRAARLLAFMQKAGFAITGINEECADLKGENSTVYVRATPPDMLNTQYKFRFHVSRPLPVQTGTGNDPHLAGVHPPQMDMIVTRAGYEFYFRNMNGIKGNDQRKQPLTVEHALRTLSGFFCDALPDQAMKFVLLQQPQALNGP